MTYYEEIPEDFIEDDHAEYCEYDVQYERDVEEDLTKVLNDHPDHSRMLGLALGLAEEIAIEDRLREIDQMSKPVERDAPAGSKLVSFRSSEDKRPKFERYVDDLIAGKGSKLPR